jgi:hypothetical protein
MFTVMAQRLTLQILLLQVIRGSGELLHVHPLELRFPFEESNRFSWCQLYLTNNTDEHVAFRLTKPVDLDIKSDDMDYTDYPYMGPTDDKPCTVGLPLYGIVPPRCTHTLLVRTDIG